MMFHRHLTFPFAVTAFCCAIAPAQQQQQSNHSEARAEARADAKNGESRSSSHRVVVVNGQKVVDEKRDDCKPAAGGAGPLPIPGGTADDMLRDLQEQVRRQMEELQRGQPLPTPPPAPQPQAGPRSTPQPTARPASQPKPEVKPQPTPKPPADDDRSDKLRPRRHA